MFSHSVYLFLREFSLQDSRGGSIGCHESKISRTDWRFIASVLCAFGMASDISPISRAFKYALDGLTNKKRPAATERSEQIQMEF
ncbi:CII family transcriptional regulator [Escherichia coli]|uniref:CII family transcriptional regulator n=1 Tax=Escherichia coli TaxID=562 RepID=UPI0022E95263|nr:CII family transcriptional regulator [Escherichia coli]MDA2835879.1 CII family transcriptional regulator [Escherichia coli]